MFMKEMLTLFKLVSDESRLRIILLLEEKELCVCQIMGVLNMSQPLVSRNLSLLSRAGFLEDRREGKLMFYRIRKDVPPRQAALLSMMRKFLKDDTIAVKDMVSLRECEEFQKKTGKCDMETFLSYMRTNGKSH
ncbi:MAG: metalloregulator ArsR/SmtB family transcription factor [Nitrospirota bacterium]